MLWSQSGSSLNPPLLLSCSSLWFTASYSMSSPTLSSQKPSLPPPPWLLKTAQRQRPDIDVSKWTTAWQHRETLTCLQVLSGRLCDSVFSRRTHQKKRLPPPPPPPHQSPGHHNCQVNISHRLCRTLCFYNECMGTRVIRHAFWPSLGGKGHSHICRVKIRLLVWTGQQPASWHREPEIFNCCISLIYSLKQKFFPQLLSKCLLGMRV